MPDLNRNTAPVARVRAEVWIARTVLLLGVGALAIGLLPEPTARLLSHPLGEAPGHIWVQWLLERSVLEGADFFGVDDVILHERLWLVPTDPLARLLSLPLGLLLGRVAAYNILTVGLLGLAASACAAIARSLGARPVAAAVGALFLIWSPALLGFAADGRQDSLGIGWLLVLGLTWLRAMRHPSLRAGLALAGAAVLTVLAGVNLAVVAATALLVPSLVALARSRRRLLPLTLGAAAGGLTVALMLSLLLSVEGHDPARLKQTSNIDGKQFFTVVDMDSIRSRRTADFWWGARRLNQEPAGQSQWVLPATTLKISHTHDAASMLRLQSFAPGGWWWLGAAPWMLLGVGLVVRPRQVWPWALGAVAFQFLGLGYGASHTLPLVVGSTRFYLAPAVLLEGLPGVSRFNNYGLFSTLAAACHGVVAALVLTGLRRPLPWALLVAGAWAFEVMGGPVPLPLPTTNVVVPDALIAPLKTLPIDQGVLVLPLSRDVNYLLQTLHGHPSPQRFRTNIAKAQRDPMLADPTDAIHRLVKTATGERQPEPLLPQLLWEASVGAVVAMPKLMPPRQGEALLQTLHATLGPPVWSSDTTTLWMLSDGRSRTAPPR